MTHRQTLINQDTTFGNEEKLLMEHKEIKNKLRNSIKNSTNHRENCEEEIEFLLKRL